MLILMAASRPDKRKTRQTKKLNYVMYFRSSNTLRNGSQVHSLSVKTRSIPLCGSEDVTWILLCPVTCGCVVFHVGKTSSCRCIRLRNHRGKWRSWDRSRHIAVMNIVNQLNWISTITVDHDASIPNWLDYWLGSGIGDTWVLRKLQIDWYY